MQGCVAMLNYDFDMFSVYPKAVFNDDRIGGMLSDMGFEHQSRGNQIALFRDPATVEALRRAPQAVQAYLRDAGFGMNTYHSGAPAGRYPAEDEAARVALIETLAESLPRHDLPKNDMQAAEGEFSLPAFLEAVMQAEPLPADAPLLPPVLPLVADAAAPARGPSGWRPARPAWLSRLLVMATVGTLGTLAFATVVAF